MYFNISPFGAQELGVDAAAEDYFGLKPQCDKNFKCTPAVAFLDQNQKGKSDPLLALARASLLAGMPQNPVSYDPILGSISYKAGSHSPGLRAAADAGTQHAYQYGPWRSVH